MGLLADSILTFLWIETGLGGGRLLLRAEKSGARVAADNW
jgi:hypothetical protein